MAATADPARVQSFLPQCQLFWGSGIYLVPESHHHIRFPELDLCPHHTVSPPHSTRLAFVPHARPSFSSEFPPLKSILDTDLHNINSFRFRAGIHTQGVQLSELPFRAALYPYAPIYALTVVTFITLTNGFSVFTKGRWSSADFVAAYIG